MPVGPQVKEGALFRAKKSAEDGCAFSVGMEGGVDFEEDGAYLYNWVSIRRCDGVLSSAPSSRLRLPPKIERAIREGAVLGDLMVAETGSPEVNQMGGAIGYYTNGILSRQAFFEECLACALAPFLHPEAYQLPSTSSLPPARYQLP